MKSYLVLLFVCAMVVPARVAAQDNTPANDSVVKADGSKHPSGQGMRAAVEKVYNAKSGVERENAYLSLVAQYPPEQRGPGDKTYDFMRETVALGFASIGDVAGAIKYLDMMKAGANKVATEGRVAYSLELRGHVNEAEQLLKDGIAVAEGILAAHQDNSETKGIGEAYAICCNYYAGLLYKQKKYPLALKYVQLAYDNSGKPPANNAGLQVEILVALHRYEEAFNKIDEALNAGKVTVSMRKDLEKVYKKAKGKEGYDDYLAAVDKQLTDRSIGRLPARMLDEPAPAFTLHDLDGNMVSLADYKGKTVVVDFWATWCGPCKASFPMMQAAVNKYKDNPDVIFLFIHTWERESAAREVARDYIESMKYSFRVLLDLKDWNGRNRVVQSFNVTGIPTKFVIDKNGRIRFRVTGFGKGNDAAAVEELSAMIALAEKS